MTPYDSFYFHRGQNYYYYRACIVIQMVNEKHRVGNTGPNTVPYFDSEKEFQNWLVAKLENNGYDAITEVRPHNSRYRADLILLNGVASPIGMELKYFKGGTDAAKAHKQIVDQYAGKKYVNRRVKRWVFAPYMPLLQAEDEDMEGSELGFRHGKMQVLQHFFNRYGIGYLDIHKSTIGRILWGKRPYQLPMFDLVRKADRLSEEYDIAKIDKRIEDRLY